MMGFSDDERILMMRSALSTQIMHVTDRRTDKHTDRIGVAYTRYSIYAVVRKNDKSTLQLSNSIASTNTSRAVSHSRFSLTPLCQPIQC